MLSRGITNKIQSPGSEQKQSIRTVAVNLTPSISDATNLVVLASQRSESAKRHLQTCAIYKMTHPC